MTDEQMDAMADERAAINADKSKVEADLAEFAEQHGEDVWTYIEHADECASEQRAEHGMGSVSMGWSGEFATASANAAAAEGLIYSTEGDATYSEAKALSARWADLNGLAVRTGESDIPTDASDFVTVGGSASDDLPF